MAGSSKGGVVRVSRSDTGIPPAYHIPVLLRETLDALAVRPDGVYIDGTAGGGGHSFAIASRLTGGGRLIALDRDPDAVAEATARLAGLPAVVARANFTEMAEVLRAQGESAADGVLLDIGVSSHQLDTGGRGFSYHAEAPLDMRMSQSGPTAAELLQTLDEVLAGRPVSRAWPRAASKAASFSSGLSRPGTDHSQ